MRALLLIAFLFFSFSLLGQTNPNMIEKKLAVKDTILIDSVSINPSDFRLFNLKNEAIDTTLYQVNFAKSYLIIKDSIINSLDSLKVVYRKYPDFLTKRYFQFDESRIVNSNNLINRIYQLENNQNQPKVVPFDGLTTSGNISRGVTVGSNQNAVLNSELDLQISGMLSEKVGLRASLQDANVPVQQNGYTQNLNEFDQIFIELYSDNWKIRAGDVDLEQRNSYFGNFTKKVQGLSMMGTFNPEGNSTDVFAAGALVRGVFTRNEFTAQEGNQGPYKLTGPNGEVFVLIVSGSESVFVNGIRLERGENNDYIIDYNAGEIIFNPTFPITSEMRIVIEFQYADRNYSRLVATGGAKHHNEDFEIGAFVYSENDIKNQPLQQNLNETQAQILSNAGDDETQMIAPSAVEDTYDENKILYRKEIINGQEAFVYSNNPEDELFQVRFTEVGQGNGDYILSSNNAIARIYSYVAPVNGVQQGNYAPIIRLFAPTKLQMAVVHGKYNPSEKTHIGFEFAGSHFDQNLFSDLDDTNNNGFAGRITGDQRVVQFADSSQINLFGNFNYLDNSFQSVERLFNVEFNRDWNIAVTPTGNQRYIQAGVNYIIPRKGNVTYQFENLDYSESYDGIRHLLNSALSFKKFRVSTNNSFLKSNSTLYENYFLRSYFNAVYDFGKVWTGSRFSHENNLQEDKNTQALTPLSQRFSSYEVYTGIGDSTAVFTEVGYRYRVNDSLRNNQLQRVNYSNNYYVKSQLIQNENTKLLLFANLRKLKSELESVDDETSLNSRILYNQFLFDKVLSLNTSYETNSGQIAMQEFTYVEVNPGEGQYTWNDYNNDGIQQLDEFEIAPFPDQAKYVRVLLPNQVFVKTHQNKFSQILTLNFMQLSDDKPLNKFLKHFYNQTSYLIDKKVEREGEKIDLNPFDDSDNELGANLSFRNSLFYNRGKQHYSTTYSYISTRIKNLLSTGLQENDLESHQVQFNHKIQESWLIQLNNQLTENNSTSENFEQRNYQIESFLINPKLSYLAGRNTRIDVFYQLQEQNNVLGAELLSQQKLGAGFNFANEQKHSINGEFNYIVNDFIGNAFSPVAYQMLQGLQPDKNYTWSLLLQKKITTYLDLNLAYYGRKSENTNTIHTGNVQLRAYF
ncbi:hypothetical protein [Mesonia sp. K7]|uniref:hypothetical protein n=1 Tax=Mesonia sp. K7 TaxID=2218606 RepID=UPI000DA857B4|nr:hypothetical protein [Mesonia sp. K7]PZD78988.1 hypothetical protein DNG35_03000 [Mesonia sp. K7]